MFEIVLHFSSDEHMVTVFLSICTCSKQYVGTSNLDSPGGGRGGCDHLRHHSALHLVVAAAVVVPSSPVATVLLAPGVQLRALSVTSTHTPNHHQRGKSFCCCFLFVFILFLFFGGHMFFVGLVIPLFWTSGEVCPGTQSQG